MKYMWKFNPLIKDLPKSIKREALPLFFNHIY